VNRQQRKRAVQAVLEQGGNPFDLFAQGKMSKQGVSDALFDITGHTGKRWDARELRDAPFACDDERVDTGVLPDDYMGLPDY
jgi:hypothetical protein